MTLRFHKTAIYFKRFFASTVLNKDSFHKICRKIENFPLKEDYPEIKGLYLSGEYFFKKILLTDAEQIGLDEIEQIRSITPIIDQGPMPFIMEQNYFEVNLPTENKSFEKLMESINLIDEYMDDLFEDITGKKIEIHMRGGAGTSLSRNIYQKAIPDLPEGKYKYEAIMRKQVETGETSLPTEFSNLPENIKRFLAIIKGPYTLKLIDHKNKLILKQTKRQEIGLSLYSDQREWFKNALAVCEKDNLFESPALLPEQYLSLPHMTGSEKD